MPNRQTQHNCEQAMLKDQKRDRCCEGAGDMTRSCGTA